MENTKITIKYQELLDIANAILSLDDSIRDPLSVCINQMKEYLKYPIECYNKEVDRINQTCCSLDAQGNYFLDEKGNMIWTKFNPAGVARRTALLNTLKEKEVDLEIRICEVKTRVNQLHISILKLLNGILFNVSEDDILEMYNGKVEEKQSTNSN